MISNLLFDDSFIVVCILLILCEIQIVAELLRGSREIFFLEILMFLHSSFPSFVFFQ